MRRANQQTSRAAWRSNKIIYHIITDTSRRRRRQLRNRSSTASLLEPEKEKGVLKGVKVCSKFRSRIIATLIGINTLSHNDCGSFSDFDSFMDMEDGL